MSSWKSQEPDGYLVVLYQKSWSVIGGNVCSYMKNLWNNPREIVEVNHIDLCLIPKIHNLYYVYQFRPISMCNSIYKVLGENIVDKMKNCIDRIVSPYQTCFIPGRSIHENIVVTREMLHSMHRLHRKKGLFEIKVDLSKSYDMISWKFVDNVLIEIGISDKLMKVIMEAITFVIMSVLWNGKKEDYFGIEKMLKTWRPYISIFVCLVHR